MSYEVQRNYIRNQINMTMKDDLLQQADSEGYMVEDYEDFKEIFQRNYTPKAGTMRICTKGVITYIFCNRWRLVEYRERGEFKKPWETHMKGGKWVIYEYYRTEANETADTNNSHTTGQSAWRIVTNQLRKNYTDEEIIDTLKQYQYTDKPYIIRDSIYNRGRLCNPEQEVVLEYTNCRYYDLNKAYAAAMIKAFPKLEKWVMSQYKKNKPKMKQIMNYFVGMMVNKKEYLQEDIFPFFRNYIVQTVSNTLDQAILDTTTSEDMNFFDSEILYANTDGFIVTNPIKELETSQTELGKFKKEQVDNDTIWFYQHISQGEDDAGYSIYQYFENGEKKIKVIGGFRTEPILMDKTDLSQGIVPMFSFKELAGLREIDKETITWQKVKIQ